MRLLNVRTRRLEEFLGENKPDYAILSHTWGEREVTFDDIREHGYQSGSAKIDGCLAEAASKDIWYIWIDTCCIDKSSTSELSRAINSMWDWYENAQFCYAYLSDVPPGDNPKVENSAFRRSRWFTRGWTLQELIAPKIVIFYDKSWNHLGAKTWLHRGTLFTSIISDITNIPSV